MTTTDHASPFIAWEPRMEPAASGRSAAVVLPQCWVQIFEAPAGHVVTLEAHAFSEQVIQVLDGCLRLAFDGVEHDLVPDNVGVIPTGVHHGGAMTAPTSMLVVTAPVGFGEDNYRLDFTQERGVPLAPAGQPVVTWEAAGDTELTGKFVSLRCVTGHHSGSGGPHVLQIVRGQAHARVGDDEATIDRTMVAIAAAGVAFEVAVEPGGALLAVELSRASAAMPGAR